MHYGLVILALILGKKLHVTILCHFPKHLSSCGQHHAAVWSADCSENMNHMSLLHVIVMMLAFAAPLVVMNNNYY